MGGVDTLTLARYEAFGNDFLISLMTEDELARLDIAMAERGSTRNDVARSVCDREHGAGTLPGYLHSCGADGFIIGVDRRPDRYARMHLLNSDGSFAETSGNGLACLAQASHDAGIIGSGPLQPFETDAGEQRCTVWHENAGSHSDSTESASAAQRSVDVAMPLVAEGPAIPAELDARIHSDIGSELIRFGTGDVGNPHLVVALCNQIDAARTAELGAAYESYFPDGVNVEFLWPYTVATPPSGPAWTLGMSVWERGAGMTVSCGTGSVVAATLARRWGFVRDRNEVDIRTAPVNDDSGSLGAGFRIGVRTDPPPQLRVTSKRIETGISFRLDDDCLRQV